MWPIPFIHVMLPASVPSVLRPPSPWPDFPSHGIWDGQTTSKTPWSEIAAPEIEKTSSKCLEEKNPLKKITWKWWTWCFYTYENDYSEIIHIMYFGRGFWCVSSFETSAGKCSIQVMGGTNHLNIHISPSVGSIQTWDLPRWVAVNQRDAHTIEMSILFWVLWETNRRHAPPLKSSEPLCACCAW